MFRASSCPSSGATTTAVAASGLPLNGKLEAATAVDKLLMMGMTMLETCWAVFKRQAIKLRDWCTCLVDLFEYMKMHGLTKPKSIQTL